MFLFSLVIFFLLSGKLSVANDDGNGGGDNDDDTTGNMCPKDPLTAEKCPGSGVGDHSSFDSAKKEAEDECKKKANKCVKKYLNEKCKPYCPSECGMKFNSWWTNKCDITDSSGCTKVARGKGILGGTVYSWNCEAFGEKVAQCSCIEPEEFEG